MKLAATNDSTIRVFTTGQWHDETASKDALDEIVERCGLFKIYREVRGCHIQPRYDQANGRDGRGGLRIDRILTPRPKLLEQGWTHGPIGIECKASGVKAGPVVAQALDYTRSVWEIQPGYRILLSWIFIWPLEKQGNFPGSVMAQNRIGSAWCQRYGHPSWEKLCLYSGEVPVLRWDAASGLGSVGNDRFGRRAGSR